MTDKIYNYFKICDDIKKIDEKILFAGIINDRGQLVAGGLREGAAHSEVLKMMKGLL